MTQSINFKRELQATVDQAIERITDALKQEGFGILTRIDMHAKFKEKLGQDVPSVIILGACNPQMAFEAYSRAPDVTSLLPCNAVVRDIGQGRVSVELAKPTALMNMLGDKALTELAQVADQKLKNALEKA
jgi:uncharacterized protein (DUF302 family)